MQSLLTDVNTAAITYRRECLQAMEKKRFATCLGCIKAMNGLLPADQEGKSYRLRINTDQYNEKIKGSIMAKCKHCKEDTERKTLNLIEINLPKAASVTVGHKTETIWICKFCKKENVLKDTLVIKNVIPQPFYCQIVPEPPKRKLGLLDQIDYERRVIEWIWLCLDNLEESFTRYRKDYKPQSWETQFQEVDNSLDEFEE